MGEIVKQSGDCLMNDFKILFGFVLKWEIFN